MADIFIYPVLFFVSTPFFIHHLGTEQFGIWMLVNTVVVSMQVFNFGIGSSVLKNTALYIGRQDTDAKARIVNSAISITMLLFVLSVAVGVSGFFLISHSDIFSISSAYRPVCARCFFLATLIVAIKFFEQIFTGYFKALEQYKIAAVLGSGNRLLGLALNIVLLVFARPSIEEILLVIIAVNSVFIVIALMLFRKSLPRYSFRFNFKIPRHESSFALISWFQSLALILTFQSDRYFILSYFGLVTLGYYALVATMFNHIHMGFSAIVPWLSPKFTKLHAQDINGIELYRIAERIVTVFSAAALIVLYLAYPFLFRWLFDADTASHIMPYMKCFILFEIFFVLSIVPSYYLNATGHERIYLYYVLCFGVLVIAAIFVSIRGFHRPVAAVYGLTFACIVSMLALRMIVEKLVTGAYRLLACIVQILPSCILAVFIISKNPAIQAACILCMISCFCLTLLSGNRRKIKLLFQS